MRRCVNQLAFVGTFVMGAFVGLFLDNERLDPVLAATEEVDLPIYVHPGSAGKPGVDCLLRRKLAGRGAILVFSPPLVGTPRPASMFCGSSSADGWIATPGWNCYSGSTGMSSSTGRLTTRRDFPYVVRDNVSDFLEHADLTDDAGHAIAHRNAETVMWI